jgi:hydrogenase assembly chaperone HypC/HupF
MCFTRPIQLKKISGKMALVGAGKTARMIDVSLLKNPRAGDWVLSQADLAIEKISAKEAKETLKLLNNPPLL